MPSTYAHFRMGREVREELEDREKEIIEAYPELFLTGLHGPDILFYYKPLTKNPVNQTGYGMHEKAGEDFFVNAARIIKEHENSQAPYLAYTYGFICHFALDVACHGYIDEKIEESGITHAEIETEFDRELLVRDGYDPVRKKVTEHIVPSIENAKVIKEFFNGVTEQQVQKALKGMISSLDFLTAPPGLKRQFIYAVLKISGNYQQMHGLLVNPEKNTGCIDSTNKLLELYQEAEELSVRLIRGFKYYLDGSQKLDGIYRYTFGSKKVE